MTRSGAVRALLARAGQADGAFRGGERFVPGQEGEALGFFLEQHRGQVAVTDAHLAVVGHGAGDAEALHAFAQGDGDVHRLGLAFSARWRRPGCRPSTRSSNRSAGCPSPSRTRPRP